MAAAASPAIRAAAPLEALAVAEVARFLGRDVDAPEHGRGDLRGS